MIRGTCPVCGRVFKVDDHYAGVTGKCKSCGADIQIPGRPDEGLDGLPPLSPRGSPRVPDGPPTGAPREPAAAAPPTGAPELPPRPDRGGAHRPPIAPHGFEPEPDARAHRPGPGHGPTALAGHRHARQPGDDDGAEAEPDAPVRADDALASRRMITTIDTVETDPRPFAIKLACVVLGLLGIAFCGRFGWAAAQGAGVVGTGVAATGIALSALGLVRIWAGHWDGLIPAFLFCLLAVGGAFLLASAAAGEGQGLAFPPFVIGLLAADALAILLLILALARGASREYLGL